MEITLYYFGRDEFGDWFDQTDPRLLVLLDSLRHQWGEPIRISSAAGAVGRRMGASLSQHNVDKWGVVRAVDVYPESLHSEKEVREFVDLATLTGFTGIGVYDNWSGGIGVHLDVRVDAWPGKPATWGGTANAVGQQRYVALSEVLEGIA